MISSRILVRTPRQHNYSYIMWPRPIRFFSLKFKRFTNAGYFERKHGSFQIAPRFLTARRSRRKIGTLSFCCYFASKQISSILDIFSNISKQSWHSNSRTNAVIYLTVASLSYATFSKQIIGFLKPIKTLE